MIPVYESYIVPWFHAVNNTIKSIDYILNLAISRGFTYIDILCTLLWNLDRYLFIYEYTDFFVFFYGNLIITIKKNTKKKT